MLKMKRIYNQEDNYVIYHYLYGCLLSIYNEKMYACTKDEVKNDVFDIRESMDIFDFKLYEEEKTVAICSLRDIDYENRKAKLYITLMEREYIEQYYKQILEIMTDFAYGQLNLLRIEGYVENIKEKYIGIDILCQNKFKKECLFEEMTFVRGKKRGMLYLGKTRKEKQE